jgi:hypothetical protein
VAVINLYKCNDNGKWLPTKIRIELSGILIKLKKEELFQTVTYDIKDYL